MDLSVDYLGIRLVSPIIVGSGPLDATIEHALACQAAGAGMLVMHSLFEEQFTAEQAAKNWSMEHGTGPMEASDIEDPDTYILHPEEYYEQLAALKKALKIPVVGSVNGIHPGNWVTYAQEMERAGADAIELNIYDPVSEGDQSASEVEARLLAVVKLVRGAVRVPMTVKLSPFYTSFGYLARRLDDNGVDGIVLFNRFFQPDIDIHKMRTLRTLGYSTSEELPMRLRWAAALSGRLRANLAVAGGVHTGKDVIKSVLAGAHAVQVVSAIMKHGPKHINTMLEEVGTWMNARGSGFTSLTAMRGRFSLEHTDNRDAYERANYVQLLRDRTGASR